MYICKMQNCIILRAVFFLAFPSPHVHLSRFPVYPTTSPADRCSRDLEEGTKEQGRFLWPARVNVLRPHAAANKNRNSIPVNSQWIRMLWLWQHTDFTMRFHCNRIEWTEQNNGTAIKICQKANLAKFPAR